MTTRQPPFSLQRLWPLLLLIAAISAAWASGFFDMFTLAYVQAHLQDYQAMIAAYPAASRVGYTVLYALVVALSLPLASLLTLLAGALFGVVWGSIVVLIGATLGATLVFLIAKTALGESLRKHAAGYARKVARHMEQDAWNYLLFLRLVPVFPFFVVNILPSLFKIPLWTYIWTTLVGIAPATIIYVNLGTTLGQLSSLQDLLSWETALALSLLGILALIPKFFKKSPKSTATEPNPTQLEPTHTTPTQDAPIADGKI